MEWTSETPTVDGFWWHRYGPLDPDSARVVEVLGDHVRLPNGRLVPIAPWSGEWCGPLVPPGGGGGDGPRRAA